MPSLKCNAHLFLAFGLAGMHVARHCNSSSLASIDKAGMLIPHSCNLLWPWRQPKKCTMIAHNHQYTWSFNTHPVRPCCNICTLKFYIKLFSRSAVVHKYRYIGQQNFVIRRLKKWHDLGHQLWERRLQWHLLTLLHRGQHYLKQISNRLDYIWCRLWHSMSGFGTHKSFDYIR